ncbi:unnamed protein product [Leptosia nina]|uniref:Uncharacterized protein n=1 Tax=Leptosia nina TaxID=320188 RepID=A0AAV1J8Y7_9NEOP
MLEDRSSAVVNDIRAYTSAAIYPSLHIRNRKHDFTVTQARVDTKVSRVKPLKTDARGRPTSTLPSASRSLEGGEWMEVQEYGES